MSKKMPEIDLADATKVAQSKAIQKKIQKLYKKVANDLAKEAKNLPKDGKISEKMRKNYLNQYVKSLEKEIDKLELEIYKEVQVSMNLTAQAVVDANIEFMSRAGLGLKGAFDTVPKEVVTNLIKGSVYKDRWTFSKALWGHGNKVKKDLQAIVAEGIAKQKPTYDIAKDLEKYVNPTAKKPWDWGKVYPGTNKKVDYNAQRLARTLIQHSYQQAYRATIKDNPFITGVIWRSVFAIGRTCEVCMDRDGQHFKKGTEPLDHPMGLCYLEPEIPLSMDEIADRLGDWANGKSDPDIDKYVRSAYGGDSKGYKTAKNSAKDAKAKPYKGKTKNPAKNFAPK